MRRAHGIGRRFVLPCQRPVDQDLHGLDAVGLGHAAACSFCVFGIGHLRDRVNENIGDSLATHVWTLTKALIPDLEIFNMKSMASYGLTIGGKELALELEKSGYADYTGKAA